MHNIGAVMVFLNKESIVIILLFSLHLIYRYALWNLAILATETNKCDLI